MKKPQQEPRMIVALVMIRCERDQIPEAAKSIVEFPGVEEVYSVTGEWDLIVKVKVLRWDEIAQVVTEHIAKVKGIQRTDTHMAFRVLSKDDISATYEGFE